MARTTPIALSVLALVTSACASYVDKPYQRIYVTTPEAENAECILRAGKSKAIAHPPQEVTIRNNNESLAITCHTPENRIRTVRYQAEKVESPKYNIPTGYASGMNYDYVEGERYKYPERAVVIFKGIEARPDQLPQYQYATMSSPTTGDTENFDLGRSLLPWEELNRPSSERSSSEGKNGDSESPDAPLPLLGKKDSGGSNGSEQIRPEKKSGRQSSTASEADQASAASAPASFEARARRDARGADQKQPQSDNREKYNRETKGAIDKPTRLYSGD